MNYQGLPDSPLDAMPETIRWLSLSLHHPLVVVVLACSVLQTVLVYANEIRLSSERVLKQLCWNLNFQPQILCKAALQPGTESDE